MAATKTSHMGRLVGEAVNAAATRGVRVSFYMDSAAQETHIKALHLASNLQITKSVRAYDHYASSIPQEVYLAEQIDEMVDELWRKHVAQSSSTVAELRAELAKYKEAVKSLAFELEMQKGAGHGTLVIESEVRKFALAQAAEMVMDWGIPSDGQDLKKLCEQITKIPREKGVADGGTH